MTGGPRSYERFEPEDLRLLGELAARDLDEFISRNPRHASLPQRVLCTALCQGAALHYVDGHNGVKDFDVWTFFADDGVSPEYPVRRRGEARFEGQRFGDSTRRVDILGRTLKSRTLKIGKDADPIQAVQGYLAAPTIGTAWHLSQKAAVLISPADRLGEIIWPRP